MGSIAFALVIVAVFVIDYLCWVRGGHGIFFKDKTQLEKDLRKLQHLEVLKNIKSIEDSGVHLPFDEGK